LLRFPASKRGEALEPVSAADQTESIQNRLGEFCALNTFRQDGRHAFEITTLEGRLCLRRSQMIVQPISILGVHIVSSPLFDLSVFGFGGNLFQGALLSSPRSLGRRYHVILHPKGMTCLSLPIAQFQPRGEAPDVHVPGDILIRSSKILVEHLNLLFDFAFLIHGTLCTPNEKYRLSEVIHDLRAGHWKARAADSE
jgi:hypothetical protein